MSPYKSPTDDNPSSIQGGGGEEVQGQYWETPNREPENWINTWKQTYELQDGIWQKQIDEIHTNGRQGLTTLDSSHLFLKTINYFSESI